MTIESARRATRDVAGWLSYREGLLLYALAKACSGHAAIVEIGSWQGKSTIWLAAGARAGSASKVYAVDPHTGSTEHREANKAVWTFDVFRENIARAGLTDTVVPIVNTSVEAAKNFSDPVELIFIDGAHEYDMVKADLEAWFPKVTEGGIIAFHDTTAWSAWEGPKRLILEVICQSRRFRVLGIVHSITYAQKVASSTVGTQMRNQVFAVLVRFYEIVWKIRNRLTFLFPATPAR